MRLEYPIVPVTKPRMTRRDKWLSPPRPGVAQYRAFKDEVKLRRITLPDHGYHVTFILPMPDSWSNNKKAEFDGAPHRQTPDKDNLEKALLDAIFGDDSHIWDGRVTKLWGAEGRIIIETPD